MIFSLFGKRKEAREQRARSRASRDGEPTTTQATTAATNTVSQREIARRTAAKIDEIESQMDMSIPAKVAKPPLEPVAVGGGDPVVVPQKDPAPVYEGGMAVFPAPEARSKAGARAPAPAPAPAATRSGIEPSTSMILGEGGEKMSKSRGNVINPNDIIDEFGADTLRLYIMFIGDFEKAVPWSSTAVKGCKRFLDRVWNLAENPLSGDEMTGANETEIHKAIKKVGEDIKC